ncbi:hypothetical protein PVAP13_7KG387201 [Panicum virgatum]|uniref:Uncharacterized protein n=1 Tax=Panicum virgatum TaxID=38727 RepID=A0A8T0QQV7_PANVG|nr:hypothetical protein PVAP13_7KG387201 [Panicum virgatum]
MFPARRHQQAKPFLRTSGEVGEGFPRTAPSKRMRRGRSGPPARRHLSPEARRRYDQGGRGLKYRPGWTVNEIPSTLGHYCQLSAPRALRRRSLRRRRRQAAVSLNMVTPPHTILRSHQSSSPPLPTQRPSIQVATTAAPTSPGASARNASAATQPAPHGDPSPLEEPPAKHASDDVHSRSARPAAGSGVWMDRRRRRFCPNAASEPQQKQARNAAEPASRPSLSDSAAGGGRMPSGCSGALARYDPGWTVNQIPSGVDAAAAAPHFLNMHTAPRATA